MACTQPVVSSGVGAAPSLPKMFWETESGCVPNVLGGGSLIDRF